MNPRRITLFATLLALVAAGGFVVLASAAQRPAQQPSVNQRARAAAHVRIADRITASTRRLPAAATMRGTVPTCVRAAAIPGQGASCRTADGLFALDARPGLLTHGPDLVDATRDALPSAVRAGTRDDIVCSAHSRSRHALLVYLLPKDHASGAADVHGDRFATAAPQLRQALYDASAMVDARATELQPGARRRIRVACDADGTPTVLRIVLPRTAAAYRAESAGFGAIIEDLDAAGLLPTYDEYQTQRVPSVRRVLGYYDADFVPGVAGQGTMYRRASLIRQGAPASSPLVGRTTRNINNSPPQASVAIQYGSAYGTAGPDAPQAASLLHELSHTMGAVQDEVPTSSGAGHCTDGLDVMCYDDDGSRASGYVETACPGTTAPGATTPPPTDLRFDCNGDTYFHPAPPLGNPLAGSSVWQLGLTANETLATDVTSVPGPIAPVRVLRARGAGTSISVSWVAPVGMRPVAYDVVARPVAGGIGPDQVAVLGPISTPVLRPATTYDIDVRAVDAAGNVGPVVTVRRRTGADTSPPSRVGAVQLAAQRTGGIRLAWSPARDNVRVARYVVERRANGRWSRVAVTPSRAGESPVISSWIALPTRTYQSVRVVAVDAGGRTSIASPARRIAVA